MDEKKTETVTEAKTKYATFTHSFSDPWADDEEITLSCRFSKPTKTQIQRLQERAGKNAAAAARALLLETVHPDDKQRLVEMLESYPGIATSYVGAIVKGIGITSELGN